MHLTAISTSSRFHPLSALPFKFVKPSNFTKNNAFSEIEEHCIESHFSLLYLE